MQFPDQKFRKDERLCSRKAFEELFDKGKSFYSFPFQVIWLPAPLEFSPPAQVALSVSRKLFRRAVKRNLIKRRMRESFRKNKSLLYEFLNNSGIRIIFIIIYKNESLLAYNDIENQMREMLKKIVKVLKEREADC